MFDSKLETRLSVQEPTPKGGPGHELGTLARAARTAEINGHNRKYVRIAALLGVSVGTLRIIVDLIG
jgi:hypothetical protein